MNILRKTFEKGTLLDLWTEIYSGNPLQARLNSAMLNRALSRLQLPCGSVFLDAGCGSGNQTIALLQRGYRGVAFDISTAALVATKSRLTGPDRVMANFCDFIQGALETLPFEDRSFDLVHCRGVLMHIPDWKTALHNLCRVLKPGGYILVMENNDRSLEAKMVRCVRAIRKGHSQRTTTDGGLESWSVVNGDNFVVRVANLKALTNCLCDFGVRLVDCLPGGFWDIGYFPIWSRSLMIQWNRIYFALHLPAQLSSGVVLLGRKETITRLEAPLIVKHVGQHHDSSTVVSHGFSLGEAPYWETVSCCTNF